MADNTEEFTFPNEEQIVNSPEVPEEVTPVSQDVPEKKQEDKWVIALMILASVLSLGIIGFLAYWLQFLVI